MKTMPANDIDHKVIKYWCKKLGVTFQEIFHMWVEKVISRKQIAFYDSLPDPRESINIVKPLENVKIETNYKINRCT